MHCVEYIARQFKYQNKSAPKDIYYHETCATDTQQIDKILSSCLDVIISMNIQGTGIE